MTLREILEQGDSSFSYKVTQAVSELREHLKPLGKTVVCYRGESPSKNRYVIETLQIPFYFDSRGQAEMRLGL